MTATTETANPENTARIAALVKSAKVGLLTTVSETGQLVSRPLATQEVDFDGELWFFTQDPSPKTDDIRANPSVNVAFESNDGYLSVAGSARVVHDADKIEELWSPSVEAWFEGGRSDPSIALIRVDAETVELWAMTDPRPVTLFKIAKAAVTGERPDVGENTVVEFE